RLRQLGWPLRLSPAGSCAAGWGLPDERDPAWIAGLPRPEAALAGLAGGTPGRWSTTYRYDLRAAYPAAACAAPYPDWSRGRYAISPREAARLLAGDRLHGIADVVLSNVPAGLLPAGTWPATAPDGAEWAGIIDTTTLRAALDEGARLITARRAVLAPSRAGGWAWYRRAFERLWGLREDDRDAGPLYKLAANGLIGRMAAEAEWVLARAVADRRDGDYIRGDGGYVRLQPLARRLTGARGWVLAALIIADVRVRLWRDVRRYNAIWWWVDCVVTPAPLPPAELGDEPGRYRLVGSGPSVILDARGGMIAGARLMASLSAARRDALLAAADGAGG
ncbi:MAG: hypothetical protein N2Z67_11270, partial [Acetobacteraceae bacterium]|nr:hypothetical protein [Acetobacteraceae bacterium]